MDCFVGEKILPGEWGLPSQDHGQDDRKDAIENEDDFSNLEFHQASGQSRLPRDAESVA